MKQMKGYYKLTHEAEVRAQIEADRLETASSSGSMLISFDGIIEQVRQFSAPVGLVYYINKKKMIVTMAVSATFVETKPIVLNATYNRRAALIPTMLPAPKIKTGINK